MQELQFSWPSKTHTHAHTRARARKGEKSPHPTHTHTGFLTSLSPSSCQPDSKHTLFGCGAASSSATTVSQSRRRFYCGCSRCGDCLLPLLNALITFVPFTGESQTPIGPEAPASAEGCRPETLTRVVSYKRIEQKKSKETRLRQAGSGTEPPIWPRLEPIWRTKCVGDNRKHQRYIGPKKFSHVSAFKYGIFMVLLFQWKDHVECSGSALLYGR